MGLTRETQTISLEMGPFIFFPQNPKFSVSRHLPKKTEQCQERNLKNKPKAPGDSTVFYKTIYISLLVMAGSTGTNSTATKYSFDFNNSSDIYLYIFIYLLIFISSARGEIKILIYKIS